jgi:HSP20 family protein
MPFVKWDPFGNVSTLPDRINKVFDDAFARNGRYEADAAACSWIPPVDIFETSTGFVIRMEVPGMKKEDVAVELRENILSVRGERKPDPAVRDDDYFRQEICKGIFQRSFTLQYGVNLEKIKASVKDGILTIELPHPAEEKPKQITIDIQ